MFYESILWSIIFLVTFLASVAGVVYLIKGINRFVFLDKFIKGKKLRKISPIIIFVVFAALCYFGFGYVNAVVIIITFTVLRIISEAVVLILKKKCPKVLKWNIYHAGVLTIILSLSYLIVGWYNAHHIVETHYTVETDKAVDDLKIVLVSDSHLGTTFDGEGFVKISEKINECKPDILLIAGDYVDGSSSYEDIVKGSVAFSNIDTKYGIYYCYGNHDRNFYSLSGEYTEEELVNELEKNNVVILQDELKDIPGGYTIVGREDASVRDRKSINDLMANADKKNFIIDINHQPSDYNNEEAAEIDMVLSGHTHGGQLIPINHVGVIIGAVDKIYGREKRSDTEFIVTSGISDWAIDFKTGCKAEYVVIDIKGKGND